jgi:hypothetical protein
VDEIANLGGGRWVSGLRFQGQKETADGDCQCGFDLQQRLDIELKADD